MLLYLCFLLAGCLCRSLNDTPIKSVLQNTTATLPCPHKTGTVTWSRLRAGVKVTLVTIENGKETRSEKRYGSLADNSLVIANVIPGDTAMYWCNRSQVYLNVATEADVVGPSAGDGPVQKGGAAAGDAEQQQPSDFWKVPVGVVAGAAVVLLAVLALRFCPKEKAERNNVDKAVREVIYEEIEAGEEQLWRESDVESPYYWTSVTETPNTSTPPNTNLYSTVNKLKTEGRSNDECVYFFAQNPPQEMINSSVTLGSLM